MAEVGNSRPTKAARMSRYRRQLRSVFFRLRFHLVEGFRYLRESILWRKYRKEFSP